MRRKEKERKKGEMEARRRRGRRIKEGKERKVIVAETRMKFITQKGNLFYLDMVTRRKQFHHKGEENNALLLTINFDEGVDHFVHSNQLILFDTSS